MSKQNKIMFNVYIDSVNLSTENWPNRNTIIWRPLKELWVCDRNNFLLRIDVKKKRITFKHHTLSRIASFVWLDWWSYRIIRVLVSLVPLDRINLLIARWELYFKSFFAQCLSFFFLFFLCVARHIVVYQSIFIWIMIGCDTLCSCRWQRQCRFLLRPFPSKCQFISS